MSKENDQQTGVLLTDAEATRLARRKLLKLSIYGIPAIVGTFTLRKAAGPSCGPQTSCNPVVPCSPNCWPSS